jgi:hypothetical protein
MQTSPASSGANKRYRGMYIGVTRGMQSRFSEPEAPPKLSVASLVDATLLFEERLNVRKLQDVLLNKLRVGVLYIDEADDAKYLLLYKRERYLHFGDHFPACPEKGHAIIANIKLVHWCAVNGYSIATMFPDGTCYSVKGREFWEFYEKWNSEHPKLKEEIALPMRRWSRLF